MQFGGPGLHVEAHDGPVGGGRPDLFVGGPGREQPLFLLAQSPVGDEDEPDGGVGRLEPLGQRERGREVGAARCGTRRRDRLVEGAGVGAGRQEHPGLRTGLDHAGRSPARQFPADLAGPRSGIGNPVGLAVEREHRPGTVDQEDGVLGQRRLLHLHRVGYGHREQADAEQLEQEQPRGSDHAERRG